MRKPLDTPLEPISRHASRSTGVPPTLRAHVVKMIGADILAGKYKPGDRLNESQIARELNISRIPVREALSQLQEQGLVVNRERRGMFVMSLSPDDVQQISSLRIVLETEAVKLARDRMTPEVLARLEKLVQQMEAWDGTLLDAAALDLEFHRVIWHAAGNPYLERALNALMVPMFAHRTLEHVSREIRRWRLNHHRALLDVVTRVSSEDPQEALLAHLRMAYTEPERYSTLARPADRT
jgi:DNA-binding GntR family transcriptional regulator